VHSRAGNIEIDRVGGPVGAPALIDWIASRNVTKPSTATVSPVPVTVIVAANA
jgi:hypothetical protein